MHCQHNTLHLILKILWSLDASPIWSHWCQHDIFQFLINFLVVFVKVSCHQIFLFCWHGQGWWPSGLSCWCCYCYCGCFCFCCCFDCICSCLCFCFCCCCCCCCFYQVDVVLGSSCCHHCCHYCCCFSSCHHCRCWWYQLSPQGCKYAGGFNSIIPWLLHLCCGCCCGCCCRICFCCHHHCCWIMSYLQLF